LNLGSGEADAEGWIHLDGSWQTRLSRWPWLLPVSAVLVRRRVGRWSRRVRYWNARLGIPFESDSVAVVYASHLLEHLYRDEALLLLRDVKRVLRPDGLCRLIVPDLAAIVGWYLDHRQQTPRPKEASSDVLNGLLGFRSPTRPGGGLIGLYRRLTDLDQHKWMYDEEGLIALCREAGFARPGSRSYLESDIPHDLLAQVEKKERIVDGAGVCVECRK
jgi:SAM-dependent methyltransferase